MTFKRVEIPRKIKGVFEFPKALRKEENQLYRKTAIIPEKITIRYSLISGHTSSGIFISFFKEFKREYENRMRIIETRRMMKNEEEEALLNPCVSFSPYLTEINTPLPMARPNIIEVKKVIRVKDDPTAAKAFFPRYLPTIMVSVML